MTKGNSLRSLRDRVRRETQNVSTQTETAKQSLEKLLKGCSDALTEQQKEIEKDIRARAGLWLKYFPIWACGTSLLLAAIWNGFAWWYGTKLQNLSQEIAGLEKAKEQAVSNLEVMELKLALNADRVRALENYNLIFDGGHLFVQMHREDVSRKNTYTTKNQPNRVLVRVQPQR